MQNCRYSHLLKAEQHSCSVHRKEQFGWKGVWRWGGAGQLRASKNAKGGVERVRIDSEGQGE